MPKFLGDTYDKQLMFGKDTESIARERLPETTSLCVWLVRIRAGRGGQRVSSTLRPKETCWSMQCRHKIPLSLKPTKTSSNALSSRQPGECWVRSELRPQEVNPPLHLPHPRFPAPQLSLLLHTSSSFLRVHSLLGPKEASRSSYAVVVPTGRSSAPPVFPPCSLLPAFLQGTHCR